MTSTGRPLRFGIVLGQRAPWPELVARTKEIEVRGFDDFNVVDHFYGLRDVMDPTHEAYTALAALAPYTSRVRLGVMVCGNTYRNPAFLLKQAITVDHVSNGRVDFGVGAGWLEREHEAYGFEFPSARERVDRFAEALEIWDLLQSRERTTYDGRYYQILDAPFEPKSLQHPRLPVLIGASAPRMLRLTAKHADIWNARGTPAEAGAGNRELDGYCAEIGRDPAAIARSVSVGLQVYASAETFAGSIAAYRAEGFTDFRIPWPRTDADYEVFVRVAEEVIPALRAE
ncbi:MAG TPA: LLM class flavin-dependent oxidoreductase [Thermomicrobiales bacterium]|nr:LLM class flavin-dependent oxidoreductase [Thermomicrobiales bacterium]